jgi:hypothetical protein
MAKALSDLLKHRVTSHSGFPLTAVFDYNPGLSIALFMSWCVSFCACQPLLPIGMGRYLVIFDNIAFSIQNEKANE